MSSSPEELRDQLITLMLNYDKAQDPNMLGIVKGARILLETGASVGVDCFGMNPLHHVASWTECTPLISLLLEFGVKKDKVKYRDKEMGRRTIKYH